MKIRAIGLDMDGTLLNSNNRVDKTGLELLEQLRENGVYVFLSTGRTKLEIHDVIHENFLVDGMITSNGAGCYTKDSTLLEAPIKFSQVEKIISVAREHGMYYEVHPFLEERMAYREDLLIFRKLFYNEYNFSTSKHWLNFFRTAFETKVRWVDTLPNIPIAKLLFFHTDKNKIKDFRKKLKQLKEDNNFSISSSSEHNVEIVNEHVTKATGLKQFLKKFQLTPDELIVFGDSENDLPMFNLAKHAVAMKNASEHIKEQADDVTDYTNDEHGVFRYIKDNKNIFHFE